MRRGRVESATCAGPTWSGLSASHELQQPVGRACEVTGENSIRRDNPFYRATVVQLPVGRASHRCLRRLLVASHRAVLTLPVAQPAASPGPWLHGSLPAVTYRVPRYELVECVG
jgi:hypothetical protein